MNRCRVAARLVTITAFAAGCATPRTTTLDSVPQPAVPQAHVPPSVSAPQVDASMPPESDAQAPAPVQPQPRAAQSESKAPPGMLLVPGGTFTMGADVGGEEDEHPAHSVTLASFWLDVTEVTVGAYLECVKAGVCEMYREDVAKSIHAGDDSNFRKPDQPVTGISWEQAKRYCEFRSKRLPREAEWERAARGDDGRKYPWGNSAPDPSRDGCFGRPIGTPQGSTCPVGAYPAGAGPYGHLDLAGNVWEWMSDYYDPYAYRRPTASKGEPGDCKQIMDTQDWLRQQNIKGFTGTNPIPTKCERVLRGGAFNYPASGLRASNRVHHPANWRLLMAGVRCAKDVE